MKFTFILIIVIIFSDFLFSNTLIVKQDGSGDYTVIQEAVDNAIAGDTIRVYPGRYYENINVTKDLSIVSNYEYTQDESYIHNTILDGNHISSVLTFIGTDDIHINNYLCGFTITNGIGYIENQTQPTRKYGGGIFVTYSKITLKKCLIYNNTAQYGGGILFFKENETNLMGCTIKNNRAFISGGGILQIYYSDITYSTEFLNNIYLNYAGWGNDIVISHYNQFQEIIVDTFTVIDPDEGYYYIFPASDGVGIPQPDLFSVSIEHGKIEQVESDLYVSTEGDNDNSGLTPDQPLKNIAFALAKIRSDSLIHRTIHVADGIYSSSLTGESLPLHVKSYVSIVGESRENTILDAEFCSGHLYAFDPQKDYSIENFTLLNARNLHNIAITLNENAEFKNILITHHIDELQPLEGGSSAINASLSDFSLDNIAIKDNYSDALYVYTTKNDPILNITNCLFKNNSYRSTFHAISIARAVSISDSLVVNIINTEISDNLDQSSGDWLPTSVAISVIDNCKVNIINSTISGNTTTHPQGAAIQAGDTSTINIVNSILYGDSPRELFLDGRYGPINLNVKNSLIDGGIWNIGQYANNNIIWDDNTVLDTNPQFVGSGDYPFALTSLSPCIDTGTFDLPNGIILPETDLAGNPRVVGTSVDMGAYEYQGDDESQENQIIIPQKTEISIYPNPFELSKNRIKSSVKIKLYLKEAGDIKLIAYNLKGQKIKTLIDAYSGAGEFTCKWDIINEHIASGVYLIKLMQNGKTTKVRKMMVVK